MYIIEPCIFVDNRGYFIETYNYNDFKDAGLDMEFLLSEKDKKNLSLKKYSGGM